MNATPSIHYRRRWFYALWGMLLLASLTILGLWETPKRSGTANLALRIQVKDLPAQTQVKVWAGPRKRWPGMAWTGQRAFAEIKPTDERVALELLCLPVAYRRWAKDIIPGRTADLVVLRFETPSQAPRYLALPLGEDWRSGLLRPGRKMSLSLACAWEGLSTDPAGFSRLE